MSNDSASEIIIDNNIKKNKKITNKVFVFNDLFTPIFIIITIVILIIGVIGLKFLDVLFAGSKYLTAIKLFGISIIVNIVILIFIIMSFSKIKFQRGLQGPIGNKGKKGDIGRPGTLQVCNETYETIQEKIDFERKLNYLDLKLPYIIYD